MKPGELRVVETSDIYVCIKQGPNINLQRGDVLLIIPGRKSAGHIVRLFLTKHGVCFQTELFINTYTSEIRS